MVGIDNHSWWDHDPNDWITTLHNNFVLSPDHSIKVSPTGLRINSHIMYPRSRQMTTIPVPLDSVSGDFQVHAALTSLHNSPREVGGSFDVGSNKLTTLEGGPERVGKNYFCENNQLTTLKGIPQSFSGLLYCIENPLRDLSDLPPNLTEFSVSNDPDNPLPLLRTLTVKKKVRVLEMRTSRMDDQLNEILHKYVGQGRAGSLACGAELARAGFKDNARW